MASLSNITDAPTVKCGSGFHPKSSSGAGESRLAN
jgi:hypothetical protein